MSDGKKPFSPFKPYLERAFRAVLLVWLLLVAIEALIAYLRPILPWIAAGVVIATTTWVVIAVVRWRRSKW
jgi:hypothetical protein